VQLFPRNKKIGCYTLRCPTPGGGVTASWPCCRPGNEPRRPHPSGSDEQRERDERGAERVPDETGEVLRGRRRLAHPAGSSSLRQGVRLDGTSDETAASRLRDLRRGRRRRADQEHCRRSAGIGRDLRAVLVRTLTRGAGGAAGIVYRWTRSRVQVGGTPLDRPASLRAGRNPGFRRPHTRALPLSASSSVTCPSARLRPPCLGSANPVAYTRGRLVPRAGRYRSRSRSRSQRPSSRALLI